MEIAKGMIDIKRYPKGPELDSNESMSDFFGIDDLLDFSGEEIGAATGEAPCQTAAPLVANVRETISARSCHIEAMLESNRPPDICIPCDDIAELEWLSNFVEESFSSADATLVKHHGQEETVEKAKQEEKGSASPISVLESSEGCKQEGDGGGNVVQGGRARRSKRARWAGGGGVCFWNTRVLWAYDDTCGAILDYSSTSSGHESPKQQKQRKKKRGEEETKRGEERRCMHCGIEKTPQWRGGPMGPKTLCNACGVRFKSGRLLPEYRPAASPTFVDSIHSNSHRKVLELHKQRTLAAHTMM